MSVCVRACVCVAYVCVVHILLSFDFLCSLLQCATRVSE